MNSKLANHFVTCAGHDAREMLQTIQTLNQIQNELDTANALFKGMGLKSRLIIEPRKGGDRCFALLLDHGTHPEPIEYIAIHGDRISVASLNEAGDKFTLAEKPLSSMDYFINALGSTVRQLSPEICDMKPQEPAATAE